MLVGLTLNRPHTDFADREIRLLAAAGPIVRAAYGSLLERVRWQAVVDGLEQAAGSATVLLVERGGGLVATHPAAERLAAEIAADAEAGAVLGDWIAAWRRGDPLGGGQPEESIAIALGERSVVAGYHPGFSARPDTVVLIDGRPGPGPEDLRRLGISRRQAEVLYLVWQGFGNARIAYELSISEHTVRHHLEHVYRRLGVSSRTAAAQHVNREFAA